MFRKWLQIVLAGILVMASGLFPMKPVSAADPAPNWELIEPTNDTVDTFVAAFSVRDFGATGDGVTDVTNVFQNLLDSLGRLGGGTVFVPEGKYVLKGTLIIPKGVTLRGEWKKPVRGEPIQGTILMAYSGRGDENAAPFITQEPSSAVRDLSIWYPEQLPDDITPYPPTIMFGKPNYFGNDFCNAKNITFVNAYSGVVFSRVNGGSSPVLNGIYGTPLSRGIEIDNIGDVGRVEWIDFSPDYWTGSGLPSSPAAGSSYKQWIYDHGTGIIMRRNDWSYSNYITIDGYNRGFHIAPSIARPGAIPNGHNDVLTFTHTKTAIYFETVSSDGIMFTHVKIDDSKNGIEVGPDTSGVIQLNGIHVDATENAISVDATSTTKLLLQQSTIQAGAVKISGGTFMPSDSVFNNDAPQIQITGQARGIVTGNRFRETPNIKNTSQYYSTINHNPVQMEKLPDFPTIVPQTHKPARMALYVATDDRFGAKNDGSTDNTEALQKALDQAAEDGGGVVFLPPGKYKVLGHLTVPTGVELKGSTDVSTVPTGPGSIIEVYAGRGDPDSEPFLKVSESSGVRGLTFNYPEQLASDLPDMAAYPYLIQVTGKNAYIVNVGMRAAYKGIDLFTYRTDGHDVDFVTGHVFKTGIRVGGGSQNGRISNLHFNQIVYAAGTESKFGSWPNSPPMSNNQPVYDYGLNNLDFLILGDAQNETLYNDFHYGSSSGVILAAENGKGPTGVSVGMGVDGARKGLIAEAVGPAGFDFINNQIVAIGGGENTQYIKTGPDLDGEISLFSSDFWGSPGYGVQMEGGTLKIQLANFHQPGEKEFAKLSGSSALYLDNSVVWPEKTLLEPGTESKLFAQSSIIDPSGLSTKMMRLWANNQGNQPVTGPVAPISAEIQRGSFDKNHPEDTKTHLVVTNSESDTPISGTVQLIKPEAYESAMKPIRFEGLKYGESMSIDLPYIGADMVKLKFILNDGNTYLISARSSLSFAAKKGTKADQPQLLLDDADHYHKLSGSWKGIDDLSASANVQWDKDQLYIDVFVHDDVHVQTWTNGDIWQGDSLQVGLDMARDKGADSPLISEFGFALGNDGTISKWRWRTPTGATSELKTQAKITRNETARTTTYRLEIPFSELQGPNSSFDPAVPIGLTLLVNDDDGSGRSGFIEYHQGIGTSKDTTAYGELVLLDGTYSSILETSAEAAVVRAESLKTKTALDSANGFVGLLEKGSVRGKLQARLNALAGRYHLGK